jgi:DNA polymerase III epsilon subunit family exonuclease
LLDTPLNEVSFVVFDLETTGLSPDKGDQIVEIGACKIVEGFKLSKETFQSLVKTDKILSPRVTKIHGITNELIKDAPDICTAMYDFIDFARGSIPVAHNASKDVAFLRSVMNEYSITNPFTLFIDTLKMSRLIYPDYKSHSLDFLIEKHSIKVSSRFKRHRALYDAEATAIIFTRMMKKIFNEYCYHVSELKEMLFRW